MNSDYKSSGVDVEAGYKSVELIKKHVKNTFRTEVMADLGGFGGMFSIKRAKEMDDPVLVSGTDGVGTKLKLAFLLDKHDSVGIDCVAMCVNDIICSGAEPLFFLDYIACGKNYPEKIEEIVKGISIGCKLANCSIVGGETAEMPGFYPEDEYDLAGFCVGILDKSKAVDNAKMKVGDKIIGLASSGVHSNGFSLVRKVLRLTKDNVNEKIEELGISIGEELIKPTKIYVNSVLNLIKNVEVKGISHITGGGFIENIPRILPSGKKAVINVGTWNVLPIFNVLEKSGGLDKMGMYNTFNMGIGMVVIVSNEDVNKSLELLNEAGETAYIIGEIKSGDGIEICLE